MNSSLEGIQRSLDMYLETKRQFFPRFYFVSNDDLLEILGQSKNPEAVSHNKSNIISCTAVLYCILSPVLYLESNIIPCTMYYTVLGEQYYHLYYVLYCTGRAILSPVLCIILYWESNIITCTMYYTVLGEQYYHLYYVLYCTGRAILSPVLCIILYWESNIITYTMYYTVLGVPAIPFTYFSFT